jgi:hypothetical protein
MRYRLLTHATQPPGLSLTDNRAADCPRCGRHADMHYVGQPTQNDLIVRIKAARRMMRNMSYS